MQEKGGIAFSLDFSYVIFHRAFLFFPIDIFTTAFNPTQ